MWQRIQTVFLLFVIMSLLAMLFLPVWSKEAGDEMFVIYPFSAGVIHETMAVKSYFPYIFVGVLIVLAIIVAFYEITRYKKRISQMKLGALNSLIITIALVLEIYLIVAAQKEWNPEIQGAYRIGLFMPAAAIIFNMLANRNIRKDEKLIRSVDRIR